MEVCLHSSLKKKYEQLLTQEITYSYHKVNLKVLYE